MKKILTIAAVLFAFAVAAVAQPKSVGVRFGVMEGAVYQHEIGSGNFIEADFGYNVVSGRLDIAGVYNFMIARPEWTSRGEWGFYAGPGVSLGTGFSKWNSFAFGLTGQVGLEYTFWFPLQLSIDLRPVFGIACGQKTEYVALPNGYRGPQTTGTVRFDTAGLYGFIPSISARYTFSLRGHNSTRDRSSGRTSW